MPFTGTTGKDKLGPGVSFIEITGPVDVFIAERQSEFFRKFMMSVQLDDVLIHVGHVFSITSFVLQTD
jgi:hypothetical protein